MFRSMMTLTYPSDFPVNGQIVKRDWNRFRTRLKARYPHMEYIWFLEFQTKRGAPHLHVLTTLDAPDYCEKDDGEIAGVMRFVFASMWARCIGCPEHSVVSRKVIHVHQKPGFWEQVKRKDGAIRYLASYASKPTQKRVPPGFENVGRFWGASQGVRRNLHPIHSVGAMTENDLRELLTYLNSKCAGWEVIPKYIWGLPLEKIDKILEGEVMKNWTK